MEYPEKWAKGECEFSYPDPNNRASASGFTLILEKECPMMQLLQNLESRRLSKVHGARSRLNEESVRERSSGGPIQISKYRNIDGKKG
ncbi:hypothetical protein EUGRSUZ_G01290 [Eucalyptus grandis]|uniref:Uncharacterized protein n=2 Tax=Eucalyptus grandis TaxID=71139 RepID=A0ACC3K2C7_EUCGR|nr:hypothetical protein EUGRSUZ_G01290 [Eucalyptus grandis]